MVFFFFFLEKVTISSVAMGQFPVAVVINDHKLFSHCSESQVSLPFPASGGGPSLLGSRLPSLFAFEPATAGQSFSCGPHHRPLLPQVHLFLTLTLLVVTLVPPR